MKSVEQRVLLFIGLVILALIVLFLAFTVTRRTLEADLSADEALLRTQSEWEHAEEQDSARIRRTVQKALFLMKIARGRSSRQDVAGLQDVAGQDLKKGGVLVVSGYDEQGHPISTWPKDAPEIEVDNRLITRLLAGGGTFQQLRTASDEALLVVGGTTDWAGPDLAAAGAAQTADDPDLSAFVATARLDETLVDFFSSSGADGFLLDGSGKLISTHGPLDWQNFSAAFARRSHDVTSLAAGGQTLRMVVLTLRDASRTPVGYLCAIEDITVRQRLLSVIDSAAIAATLAVLALLVLAYRWILGGSLSRLSEAVAATTSLAQGDTSVEVLGADRKDEVGQIARAIKVFRTRLRRLRDGDERRRRQMNRQQDFIRLQMIQLSETLSEEGRQSFLEDLARIEASRGSGESEGDDRSLAVAVEVMASRVGEQHKRLDVLVTDLKAALDTKTELFQLQQQVEVARGMLSAMLPRGLAPREGLEISGNLTFAQSFDGGFYDYFLLPDGRLAGTIGQPGTGGLAAGFSSVTARTSLRALLLAGLPPSDSLSRTALLLTGDGALSGYCLAAFTLDIDGLTLTWAAAGVDPPFLMRRLGDVLDLPITKEPPLAGETERRFEDARIDLPRPSSLLVVSPGMMETIAATPISRDRYHSALREADDASPQGMMAALRKEGLAGGQGLGMKRDRLCIALRVGG